MDVDRWRRLEAVLDDALTRPPGEWPALLGTSCSGDPELRAEVEGLLARLDTARAYLDTPPAGLAAAVFEEAREGAADPVEGRRVGPYRIVREIGRGGMARVFLAERADGQFRRRVALKLLRPGLDTDLDRERFRAERQILANLDHPDIARLLDGGVTSDDQPYLVLEHVEGRSIDRYCEDEEPALPERLRLFLSACDATQHAHRNLVVHRDIKPSNILVDGGGRVKLLDFGLARLLETAEGASSLARTRTSVRWMTPEYAAPEQVAGGPVTTLTDVYQLGALLYRLVAGRSPFAGRAGGPRELEDAILHEDPRPPSAVVAGSDPGLARQLVGDLDAIALKALRKEPERRFPSVEALADDVRRHLSGHPVRARRQTATYRARRFVRRNRVQVAAGGAVLLSLVAGATLSAIQARHAVAERERADDAAARTEDALRESEAVTAFLLGLFEPSDPSEARGDTLTARDLLARGVARVERLGATPAVQADMLEVTGRAYLSVGRFDDARATLERALALRGGGDRPDSAGVAGTLGHLGDALARLGRYAAADSAARRALAIQRRVLGAEDPALAFTLHRIANLAIHLGDLAEGEAYHRRTLELRRRALGPDHPLTATSHLAVGATLRRRGRFAEAEREVRRGLAIHERGLHPDDPEIADAAIQLAYLLDEAMERPTEAEPLYRRALDIRRRAFGDAHPMVAYTLSDLASFHVRRGRPGEGVPLGREHLAILRRAYGPEHPVVITSEGILANMLARAGLVDEAEASYRRAIASERRLRGPDAANVAGHAIGLARLLVDRGDLEEAEELLLDAIRVRTIAHGPGHSTIALTQGMLGMLKTRAGDLVAADTLLGGALRDLRRHSSDHHRDVRQVYAWLADLEEARDRPEVAGRYRGLAASEHSSANPAGDQAVDPAPAVLTPR